mgnify:CR=1 FL=1
MILGAGDTFRAAAAEQLKVWGDRVGVDVISPSSISLPVKASKIFSTNPFLVLDKLSLL